MQSELWLLMSKMLCWSHSLRKRKPNPPNTATQQATGSTWETSYHFPNPFSGREFISVSNSHAVEPHVWGLWFRLSVLSQSRCLLLSESSLHFKIYFSSLKVFSFWRQGFWFLKHRVWNLSLNHSKAGFQRASWRLEYLLGVLRDHRWWTRDCVRSSC